MGGFISNTLFVENYPGSMEADSLSLNSCIIATRAREIDRANDTLAGVEIPLRKAALR